MAGHRVMKNGKIQIIITHGTDYTGKPKRYYKTVDACSKKKLAEEDARFLAEIMAGEIGTGKKMTVGQLWTQFRADHCRSLKPSTVGRYETLYKQHIKEHFENRKVSDVTRADVRRWVEDIASTPTARDPSRLIARKTISNALGLLRTMFNYAEFEMEMIDKNPCMKIRIPKKDIVIESNALKLLPASGASDQKKERYTEQECIDLMNALMRNRTTDYAALRHATILIMIIFTGLRTGEVMGLRWSDVDLDKKHIKVERSRVAVQGVGVSLNSTKTDSSTRQISIPDVVVSLLLELKSAQDELRRDFGRSYTPSGYIASLDDGTPQNPRSTYSWFKRFLKNNGFRSCSIHDLRHTHAAMLTRIGVDIIDVSKRMGHSNTRITQEVYEYLFKNVDDQIGKELDDYISGLIVND